MSNQRGSNQRSVGWISFSLIAHSTLLAVLILSPKHEGSGYTPSAAGGNGGVAFMELEAAGASSTSSSEPVSSAEPSQVLLDQSNPEAVALPEKTVQPAKPIAEVKPLPAPKPIANEAPVKPVAPLPAKKIIVKAEPITKDNGDVAVKAALANARQEKPKKEEPKVETKEEAPQRPIEVANEELNVDTSAEPEAPAPIVEEEEEIETAALKAVAMKVADVEPADEEADLAVSAPAAAAPVAAPANTAPSAGTTSGATTSPNGSSTGSSAKPQNGNGPGQAGDLGPMRASSYGIPSGVQIREARELRSKPGNVNPAYPQQDRLASREGLAVVVGKIRPDGSVSDVYLEKKSGSSYMDDAALKSFKTWKFQSGQEGFVRQPFRFALKGEAQAMPARLGDRK